MRRRSESRGDNDREVPFRWFPSSSLGTSGKERARCMADYFQTPDFSKHGVELRVEEDGVVCIYGTSKGLRTIAHLCLDLVKHPGQGHIHLESYDILTPNSKRGAIAIFEK